jgi:transcriptional regulator with XRE-family HTH domain
MPKSTPVKRAARHMHPMDIHIGQRIRQRRILLGMNIWNLGAAVGLSFQMIQKYEASVRHNIAKTIREIAAAPLSHGRGSSTSRLADNGQAVAAGRRLRSHPGAAPPSPLLGLCLRHLGLLEVKLRICDPHHSIPQSRCY